MNFKNKSKNFQPILLFPFTYYINFIYLYINFRVFFFIKMLFIIRIFFFSFFILQSFLILINQVNIFLIPILFENLVPIAYCLDENNFEQEITIKDIFSYDIETVVLENNSNDEADMNQILDNNDHHQSVLIDYLNMDLDQRNNYYILKSFQLSLIKGIDFSKTTNSFYLIKQLIHEQNRLFQNTQNIIDLFDLGSDYDYPNLNITNYILILEKIQISNSIYLSEINNCFLKVFKSYNKAQTLDYLEIKTSLYGYIKNYDITKYIVHQFLDDPLIFKDYIIQVKNSNIFFRNMDLNLSSQIDILFNYRDDQGLEDNSENLKRIVGTSDFQNILNLKRKNNITFIENSLQNYLVNYEYTKIETGVQYDRQTLELINELSFIENSDIHEFFNFLKNTDNHIEIDDRFYLQKIKNLNKSFINDLKNSRELIQNVSNKGYIFNNIQITLDNNNNNNSFKTFIIADINLNNMDHYPTEQEIITSHFNDFQERFLNINNNNDQNLLDNNNNMRRDLNDRPTVRRRLN